MSSTTTASPTTGQPTRVRRLSYLRRCKPSRPLRHLRRQLPTNGEEPMSSVHEFGAPLVQRSAVSPRLGDALARSGRCDPRFDGPALPVDEPLVPQQVGARMVLRIRRRDPLELLPLHVVALLSQLGDDRDKLLAGAVGCYRLAQLFQLPVVDHVAPAV